MLVVRLVVPLLVVMVNEGALSELAVLDDHLVRNVLVDFAALELIADALLLLDAEAPLLMEELLHVLLIFMFLVLFRIHEDGGHQGEEYQ